MDFFELIDNIIVFFSSNIAVTIILGIVLLYLLVRKTGFFFTLLFIVAVLAGALYLISLLSTAGTEGKKSLIQEKKLE